MKVEDLFSEHWPLDSMHISCNECGKELYSGSSFAIETPSYVETLVYTCALKHARESGHVDVDVGISSTDTVKEIDNTITVENV